MTEKQVDSPQKSDTGRRNLWLLGGGLVLLAVVSVCFLTSAVVAGGLVLRRIVANVQITDRGRLEIPATPLSGEDAPGVPDTGSGRIAVVTPDGGLVTLRPDGNDLRDLGSPGVRYQFPAWSSSGAQVAVIASDGTQTAVQVLDDSATPDATELYASAINPPFYLYWSPDDRQVSFLANDRNTIALWLAAVDGQAPARKIAAGQPFYWEWTADSRQLLVHIGGLGAESRLAFIDADGNAVGDNLATPGLFQAPGIAPDGRYLAFSQVAGEQFEVAVQETRSGAQSTTRQLGLAAMSWSPAGNQLAFISPARQRLTHVGPLQIIDAATGATRTLADGQVIAFFWSPDGKSIATLTENSGHSTPGAALPREFTSAGRANSQQTSEVLLDLAIVDVASGQSRTLASFRPTDPFLSQFLPYFDQYALSHRIWSPASDALVLPMVDDRGQPGIFVVSQEGGAPRRIADGVVAFWSWQ